MLCVISGANWNNGGNAGVWALNLNNARGNSNNNVGFRSDSMPNTPYAARADWQRGSLRRALRRNVLQQRSLVAPRPHVGLGAKTGAAAQFARPA